MSSAPRTASRWLRQASCGEIFAGGGSTDAERAARERIRLQGVACVRSGEKNREVAAALRGSDRSVERRRRQWREDGHAGVASKGSPGPRTVRCADGQVGARGGTAARRRTGETLSGGPWPG
ncbi:helix-turn-helix domain-containing protein [Streptomyces sp. NBC_00654]|uniref:helix-turn-helix domain-containing protein n=1 Tax=Streptomyces sp. NBC_00654 TaxID=2975799 RepID=UPI0022543BAD|nr:helix-turn-helix domain-containing protein [Streptomyces sp. NBC_00654]MCX4966444.1 helix-turn-helix domain-containing protein [Streptomyces sp. NBC_00654]